MENNLTGVGHATESHRTDWSPGAGANGGLSQQENPTKTAGDLGQAAQPYVERIGETVSQAKDYLSEKVSTVGGKIKDFSADDLSGMAEKAKDFARQNPGQAILVAAAAGVLLGLIVRGRR
jgi:ElaB/YqjD/DUF883 family membrane-anchored ribosome-binding protein